MIKNIYQESIMDNKNKKLIKNLLITKLRKNDEHTKEIHKKLKENFDNPDKYLSLSPNIMLKKLNMGPRFDDNKKAVIYSFVGPSNIFNKQNKLDSTTNFFSHLNQITEKQHKN